MKKLLAFFYSSLLLLPTLTFAHVKWFVTPSAVAAVSASPIATVVQTATEGMVAQTLPASNPLIPIYVTWIFVGLLLIVIALLLDQVLTKTCQKLQSFGEKYRTQIIYLFQVLVGISLLSSVAGGTILVPHIIAGESIFGKILLVTEGIAGILLILNVQPQIGGGLLLLTALGIALYHSPLSFFEYVNVFGIGLALHIYHATTKPLQKLKPYALPILRITTAIALIVLAFSEKLLAPELSTDLLRQYPLNFMPTLGFSWFTNSHFIISAGAMEAVLGIILLLGAITRIDTIALAIFLVATNSFFFAIGNPGAGMMELLGHLPVLASAILFIIYGSSGVTVRGGMGSVVLWFKGKYF